jgi:hypothetical protein
MYIIMASEYFKKWYIKNRDKHLQNMKKKVMCETCSKNISKYYINKHQKSARHLKLKSNAESNTENNYDQLKSENEILLEYIKKELQK